MFFIVSSLLLIISIIADGFGKTNSIFYLISAVASFGFFLLVFFFAWEDDFYWLLSLIVVLRNMPHSGLKFLLSIRKKRGSLKIPD